MRVGAGWMKRFGSWAAGGPPPAVAEDDCPGPPSERDRLLQTVGAWSRPGVLMLASVEGCNALEIGHGPKALRDAMDRIATRLRQEIGRHDTLFHLQTGTFGIALSPRAGLSLETCLTLATRLQHAMADPVTIGNGVQRLSLCVGFTFPDRADGTDAASLLRAATRALQEARSAGGGAIRSYSDAIRRDDALRAALADEVDGALRNGQITAYFQPQIDLTGSTIIGFETLSRWQHPTRGLIPPAEFLPAIAETGRMADLGDLMVRTAIEALTAWDRTGTPIARIGVNFSGAELCDPHLADRIALMVDASDITADRLAIEVLETVAARAADDRIATNLSALARMGCGIDLDDFGTGHASITTIRRLSIKRIKIDRSFVSRIDRDKDQQDMVAAILTMADRLGLTALAEGIETPVERRTLQELGCREGQGFLFARPMPLDEATGWIAAHRGETVAPVLLRRETG